MTQVANDRTQKHKGKKTINNSGNAREQLQCRFQPLTQRLTGIINHVNGGQKSEKQRKQQGNHRYVKCAPQQGPRRERAVIFIKARIPLGRGEKVKKGDVCKKMQTFGRQRHHDAEGGENRHKGAQK